MAVDLDDLWLAYEIRNEVHEMNAGGWHRFKDHLEDIGLIRAWFDYQERRTNEALKAWCEAQGVEVTERK